SPGRPPPGWCRSSSTAAPSSTIRRRSSTISRRTMPTGRACLAAKPAGRSRALCRTGPETVLQAGIIPLVVLDIHRHSRPQDQDYFRRSRAERFGRTLEEIVRDRDSRLPAFRASLDPLRRTVERQDFVSGKVPAYADYVVFGAFQW